MTLVNALPGAAAQGLIWGIMAIGVYITYKVLDIADLTVDGTLCTGGAVCIMLHAQRLQRVGLHSGGDPAPAWLAGLVTGTLPHLHGHSRPSWPAS